MEDGVPGECRPFHESAVILGSGDVSPLQVANGFDEVHDGGTEETRNVLSRDDL